MKKVIFYEENPKYPKLSGVGKKPNEYIIKIQTIHSDGHMIDRILAYANGLNDLKTKLRKLIKEKNADIEVKTNRLLTGNKTSGKSSKSKVSREKVPEAEEVVPASAEA